MNNGELTLAGAGVSMKTLASSVISFGIGAPLTVPWKSKNREPKKAKRLENVFIVPT